MKGVIGGFEAVRGLPLARWRVVVGYEDLFEFGFPVYLKADVVGHKSEMGAVVRCDDLRDAERKLRKMHKDFPKNRIVVQESFEGIEMIVGLKRDEVFGMVLVVGFGGIFAEVKRDVSFRALPVSRRDVVEMVSELDGFGVFGARGKSYDLEKFYTLIEKVAWLGGRKDWKELDLNPVVVGEKGIRVVDVRID
ncbi:acetate--CoA ligase family protein [Candidatus Pacearchaeota archaeon]|nr:acetate--CoA ligase family protein [Candidatus Pacearchaeota archaeon]